MAVRRPSGLIGWRARVARGMPQPCAFPVRRCCEITPCGVFETADKRAAHVGSNRVDDPCGVVISRRTGF